MLAHDCRDAFSGQGAKREEGAPTHHRGSTGNFAAWAGTRVEESAADRTAAAFRATQALASGRDALHWEETDDK